MSNRILTAAALVVCFAVSPLPATAQEGPETAPMFDVDATEVTWNDIEVPGFLPGMKIATIAGDPSVADEPYTLRLLFPDGYLFPPHWHPRAENVTVLEGSFLLAMGETFDEEQLKSYGPGDYLYVAAENPHYGGAEGRTVIQLHGIGPFDILVVEGEGMSP